MKKALLRSALLLAASLLTLGARAQQAVPNGTLETWVTRNGSDAPGQWLTTDDLAQSVFAGFPPTATIAKSTDRHAGSFAAKLTTATTLLGPVPGVLVLGNKVGDFANANTVDELGGTPYTSRPAHMQFYYKFTGTIASPDDQPMASVQLTKTNAGVRRIIASGQLNLTPAGTYTLADVLLTYQAGTLPDSIHIGFSSADFNGTTYTVGNALYVDDVVMTGTVAATRDAQLQAAVSVYPNPSASGRFTLTAAHDASLLAAPLTVTDALGRIVLQQTAPANASGTRAVDLSAQPAGVYSLRLDTPRGPVVHQLLIP